jgi:glycosyltransferase involved in cell wall biosynthesis
MVDPASLAASTKVNVDFGTDTPYLLSAGKLIPTKGFNLLLDFLADAGCVKPLVIAGDGPARGSLEEQATALGLPVRFLGWIPHDRLLNLQRNAHAVLLPSAWNEPLSRIVLETMALSVPVIAWNRGGSAEMIESGVNGWLVSSPGDLALALDALESNECKRRIGEAALERVVQHYTPDVVYPMIAAQYSAAAEEVV